MFAQFYDINKLKIEATKDYVFEISESIIAVRMKKIERFIIESLYDAFKDTDISKIFLIDIEEFERFLIKMLPIWKEWEDANKFKYHDDDPIEYKGE